MQSSPPPTKTRLIIPSSPPPLPLSVSSSTGLKRFLDIEPSSDDIPAFSSDDLPPKEVFADPYHSYRSVRNVKRQRSGTIRSLAFKRGAERTLNSSDNVDEDEFPGSSTRSKVHDSIWSDENEDEANTSLTTIVGLGSQDDYYDGDILDDLKKEAAEKDEAEIKANLLIEKAIEEGTPVLDLSNFSLKRIPSDMASLSSLITQPTSELKGSNFNAPEPSSKSTAFLRSSSGIDPTVSTPFTSLRPELHLYLGGNSLTKITPSLTGLTDTTVLSLRQNSLRELPAHMKSMTSLKGLTLSHNSLAYLPIEMLQLKNLEYPGGMNTFPNPWFTFYGLKDDGAPPPLVEYNEAVLDKHNIKRDVYIIRWSGQDTLYPKTAHPFVSMKNRKKHDITFITSTPISVFNETGHLVTPPITKELPHPSAWVDSEFSQSIFLPILSSVQPPPSKDYVQKFPSLQELCLRKMAVDPMYTTLSKYQREDLYSTLPEHLQMRVASVLEDPCGLKTCTVCNGTYVTKGAEWIEFWEIFFHSNTLKKTLFSTTAWMIPSAMDTLLQAQRENTEIPERKRQDAALVADALEATKTANAFLRTFYSRGTYVNERRTVLPLLREVCSWECADAWMRARMDAEVKQMSILRKRDGHGEDDEEDGEE